MTRHHDQELADRLRSVIETHGGAYAFARDAGLNKQTVYNALETGNSLVVIKEVARLVPGVDLAWLLLGTPQQQQESIKMDHPPQEVTSTRARGPDPLAARVDELLRDAKIGPLVRNHLVAYLAGIEHAQAAHEPAKKRLAQK